MARDLEVRQAFPEGIYWLTIGQKPDLLMLQGQLLRHLTDSKPAFTTEQEGKDALGEALLGRRALVVVDDVWIIDHADAFLVTAPPPGCSSLHATMRFSLASVPRGIFWACSRPPTRSGCWPTG